MNEPVNALLNTGQIDRSNPYVPPPVADTFDWRKKRTPDEWEQVLELNGLEDQYKLPKGTLKTFIAKESSGNPVAVSPSKAKGLFQFLDSTAKDFGIDPLVPKQAAVGAAQYISSLAAKYGGDYRKAAGAYHSGPGNVDKALAKSQKTGADWADFLGPHGRDYVATVGNTIMNLANPTAEATTEAGQSASSGTFDIQAAMKDGIPLNEIVDHLAQEQGFDVVAARKDGIPDEEIAQHLTGMPPTQPGQRPETQAGKPPPKGFVPWQGKLDPTVSQQEGQLPEWAQTGLTGVGQGLTNVLLGGRQRFADVTGSPDKEQLQQQAAEKEKIDKPLLNTTAGQVGSVIGQTAPFLAAAPNTLIGALGLGAVQGLSQPTTSDADTAVNTALGGGLGLLGGAVGKVVGRALSPATRLSREDESIAAPILKRGGGLLPGQATGDATLQGIEASAEAFPPSASAFAKVKDSNQTAINQLAVESLGEKADKLTPDVASRALRRIQGTFNAAAKVKELPINTNKLGSQLIKIADDVQGVIPLKDHPLFIETAKLGNAASGTQLMHLSNRLGTAATQALTSPTGDRTLGRTLYSLKDFVDDQIQSGLPKSLSKEFATARQQYRNLMILTKNANVWNEGTGNVNGVTLAKVLRKKDAGYMYGTGEDDLAFTLDEGAKATPSTLPLRQAARFARRYGSQIGNSGTSTRAFLPYLLSRAGAGVGIGAGAGALAGDPKTGAGYGIGLPIAGLLASRGAANVYTRQAVSNYLRHGLVPLGQTGRNVLTGLGASALFPAAESELKK